MQAPRPHRFRNTDPTIIIGNIPWYEMTWRTLRGDFTPLAEPPQGYPAFAKEWSVAVDHARINARQQDPVVTWLGHVTILLQVAGVNILIDPTLAKFAGPWGRTGAARRVPAPLTAEALPPIDVVLISHNHYDHLCYETLSRLLAAGQRPQFYVPLGLKPWFKRLENAQTGQLHVHELNWWEHAELKLPTQAASNTQTNTLRLHFTPAQHWSRRTAFDTNASLWGGYLLEWHKSPKNALPPPNSQPWRFFFPGDTGYSADFKRLRERLGPVDFLALPIGAYLPRDFMKNMHVNPADAVQLMLDVEAKQAMAVHWGTFMLTQESFNQPPIDLAAALRQHHLPNERVWLLKHGETRAVPMPAQT